MVDSVATSRCYPPPGVGGAGLLRPEGGKEKRWMRLSRRILCLCRVLMSELAHRSGAANSRRRSDCGRKTVVGIMGEKEQNVHI